MESTSVQYLKSVLISIPRSYHQSAELLLPRIPTLLALRTLGFILQTSNPEGEVGVQDAKVFEHGNPRVEDIAWRL